MSKKIVVITGSPREHGNSAAMADSFIKAAELKGYKITRVDAAKGNFGGCHACRACFKTGKACAYDDNFNKIAPAILEADGIVLVSPIYWFTFTAQIKGIIDKFFAFLIGGRDVSGKKCALISCCEDKDEKALDAVRIPYEKTAKLLKWESVGTVLVPGVLKEGDIDQTDGCKRAAELAERF